MTPRRILAVIAVGVFAVGLTLVGGADGQSSKGNITAEDPIVDVAANHTAEITIESDDGVSGSSLTGLRLDYSASTAPDLGNVTVDDVVRAGIDTDQDGTIEEDAISDLDDVTLSNGGETISFDFGGSVSISADDRIILEYSNLTNPDTTGPHDVEIVVNPSSSATSAVPRYELLEPLEIERFAFETDDREADLVLNASEKLDDIEVAVDGDRSTTLDEGDFIHHGNGNYTAENVSEGDPGDYDATLRTASNTTDGFTRDAADGQTANVTIGALSIVDGESSVTEVAAGETVTDQTVTAEIENLSNGNGHAVTFAFPNDLDGEITDATVTTDAGAASQPTTTVDGNEVTGTFDLDDWSDLNDLNVTLDADVTYPTGAEGDDLDVDATVDDADGSTDTKRLSTVSVLPIVDVAGGSMSPDEVDAGGTVTDQTIEIDVDELNRDGAPANVSLAFPDALANEVTVTDVATDTGTVEGNRTVNGERVDVDLNVGGGGGTADANLTVTADVTYPTGTDGNRLHFDATAEDSDGNSDSESRVANVSVGELDPVAITDGSIDPNGVDPGETVTQNLTVEIGNLTRDGEDAELEVVFPDPLDGNYTVTDATAADATVEGNSTSGSTTTVTLDAGSGGGTTDATVELTVEATYHSALEDGEYGIDASIDDTDGTSDTSDPLVRVAVGAIDTGIDAFSLSADDGDDDGTDDELSVEFESLTELSAASVAVTGPIEGTLDRGDLVETEIGDGDYRYSGTLVVGDGDDAGGDYEATLESASDVYDNDVSDGESDTATIERAVDDGDDDSGGSESDPPVCSPSAESDLDGTNPVEHETAVCARPGSTVTAEYVVTDHEEAIGVSVLEYEIVADTRVDFDLSVTVRNGSDAGIDAPRSVARPVVIDVERVSGMPDSVREGTLVVGVNASAFGDAPPTAIDV
ncbi:hypothetical protein ACFQAS_09640 [Halopenitus salinus]|uniref:Uncharacterized protein n=1 Tax=Halopenitus salinus TaxID=1198295 RepID=A0ABD5USY6_9EURY